MFMFILGGRDMSYNQLVSLHPSFLKGLNRLEYLDMSHNHLSTIMIDTFREAPNIVQM